MKAAGFAGMCVARCQLGLGPSVSILFPQGLCQAPPARASVRHPQLSPLKTVSMCSCLHLSPSSGWGLAPQLDQSCHVAARPLHDPILMAVALFLGPHPRPQSLFPERKQHGAGAHETTLCVPASGSHRAPPPGVLPHREWVLKVILQIGQQTLHSKKQKTLIFCVPKTVDMLAQHPQDQAVA